MEWEWGEGCWMLDVDDEEKKKEGESRAGSFVGSAESNREL